LLLRDAVNAPTTQKYLTGRHAYNSTIWEQRLQCFNGSTVVGIVEHRHHDAAIGNVKVDVRLGQAIPGLSW
jgi:hypothetical protein